MKLTEYLQQKKIDRAKFAELLDCSERSIRLWERGRMPQKKWRDKIFTATGGEVRTVDFIVDEREAAE